MIRPDLLNAVSTALKSHRYLSQDDFSLYEFEKAGKQNLTITYRYDRSLFLNFIIPTERIRVGGSSSHTYSFHVTVRPGCEAVEESFSADGRHKLVSELEEWLSRLYADVVSVPVVRQLQEHELSINQLKERLDGLPDEPISQTEVNVFNEGLEKLRAEILTRLEEECDDKQHLADEVNALSKDIDFLKQTLESMTKLAWGELLVSRFNKWQKILPLAQIASVAMKLLGSGEAGDVTDRVEHAGDRLDQ